MKCIKCRKKIPDKSKFCNFCGTKQENQHFYRRPDGLFEKVLNIDGKRVAFRAKTEDEVWTKIRTYQVKQELGITFEEAAELWYDDHWETLSPTTQRGYKYAYEEIKKHFAGKYIRQMAHKDISRYMKSLPRSYARKTCLTRLMLLNMIFKNAITEDLCETNPCEYITVPKGHTSKKRRAPTEDEIRTIRSSIGVMYHDLDVGLLAVFFFYTGLRKGETLALTFGDIDRERARIRVTKSVYFINNTPKLKKPKTAAGIREVIVPNMLLELLPSGEKDEYVFGESPADLMRQHFFDKAWAHWQKETGLDLTAHQLRHGYATLLHEAGIDVKDAQDLLGHADASTTQNIYTEVSHTKREKTAKILNDYLTH